MDKIEEVLNYIVLKTDTELLKSRVKTFYKKEPEMLEWLNFFAKQSIELFFDVGANIGLYSLFWQNLDSKNLAIAFEPNPSNYKFIQKLIKKFKLNIIVEKCPCDSVSKPFTIKECGLSIGESKFKYDSGEFEKARITTTTIDNFTEINKISKPYILKIDVDGKDFDVLRGAVKSLNNKQIVSVDIELDLDAVQQVDDFLAGHGLSPDLRFNYLPTNSRYWRRKRNKSVINRIYSIAEFQPTFVNKIVLLILYSFKRVKINARNYLIRNLSQLNRNLN